MKIKVANTTALIDKEDYELLSQYTWFLSNGGYAIASKDNKSVYMHRLVMNTPNDLQAHHINHDRLDNRKKNLDNLTRSENLKLRRELPNKHGYKGLQFDNKHNRWLIQRYFSTKQEALTFAGYK